MSTALRRGDLTRLNAAIIATGALCLPVAILLVVWKWPVLKRKNTIVSEGENDNSTVQDDTSDKPQVKSQSKQVSTGDWSLDGYFGAPLDEKISRDSSNLLISRSLPCSSIDFLRHLYQPNSLFLSLWESHERLSNVQRDQWSKIEPEEGSMQWVRTVSYHMPINPIVCMGASEAHTTEEQTIHHFDGHSFSASVTATTPNVPMGKLFFCRVIIHAQDENRCQARCTVNVYGEIVFHKRQPIKERLVRKPALNNMRATYFRLFDLVRDSPVQPQIDATLQTNKSATPQSVEDFEKVRVKQKEQPERLTPGQNSPSMAIESSSEGLIAIVELMKSLLVALVLLSMLFALDGMISHLEDWMIPEAFSCQNTSGIDCSFWSLTKTLCID